MITTLAGTNSYLLARKLRELVDAFVAEHSDLAVERLDGLDVETQDIIDAVQSLPFLSARKLVVVQGLGLNKATAEAIEQIINSVSDSTDLVIYEPTVDRRTVYFKELKSKTELEEINELDPRQLATWLVGEAKKQNGELSLVDANYLIERLGNNQWQLANEIDKLITYNPKISRETIELMSEPNPQSRIFDLLDAAFSQDKRRAIKLYDDQRAQRVEPQAILAMLAWQLRLLTVAKHMGQRPASEVSKETGISEYPLRKAKALADKFDNARLKTMVHEALEIDVKSKSSPMDLDEALKNYIVTL